MVLSHPLEIDFIIAKLHVKIFRKQDTSLTYRAINHYQMMGLIQDNRMNNRKWRKFDGIEFIWIKTIEQLREFGVSIENILNLKTKIFVEGNLGYIDKADFINRSFEQEIAFSIHNNYKLYLILFSDFTYTFHDTQSIEQWIIRSYKDEPHISIPLYDSIQQGWRVITKKEP